MLELFELLKDKPQLIAVYLSYPLFLWFLFISIYGREKYRKQSMVMACVWGFYCCCFIFNLYDPLSVIEMFWVLILIDSVTALILVTNQFRSRYSCKIALTLVFAVICHYMILCYKTTTSSEVIMFNMGVYTYYDELIATVGILQLLVSYDDGFRGAIAGCARSLRAKQVRLLCSYNLFIRRVKGYIPPFKQKNKERRN